MDARYTFYSLLSFCSPYIQIVSLDSLAHGGIPVYRLPGQRRWQPNLPHQPPSSHRLHLESPRSRYHPSRTYPHRNAGTKFGLPGLYDSIRIRKRMRISRSLSISRLVPTINHLGDLYLFILLLARSPRREQIYTRLACGFNPISRGIMADSAIPFPATTERKDTQEAVPHSSPNNITVIAETITNNNKGRSAIC